MKVRLILGVSLLALLPAPAQAAPQQKVDPAKEADIRRLMELTGAKKLIEQSVALGVEQLRATFAKSLPPGERSQKLTDTFLQRFQKRLNAQKMIELTIPIYDKHFSAEDLKALIQFYETPLGQRLVKVLPEIAKESQAAGFELGQKVAAEVLQEMQEEFPELKQGENPPPNPQP